MVRKTSYDAFVKITESGHLSKKRSEVYGAIWATEPCTSGEALTELALVKPNGSNPLSQSRARFTELRDMGMIEEAGSRPCRISGIDCIVWVTTGRVDPLPLRRKSSELARWRDRIVHYARMYNDGGTIDDVNYALMKMSEAVDRYEAARKSE